MSIRLSYCCTKCRFGDTGILDDAQAHANATGHEVQIRGTLTANKLIISPEAIAAAAEKKLREAEILRQARDRGLL